MALPYLKINKIIIASNHFQFLYGRKVGIYGADLTGFKNLLGLI